MNYPRISSNRPYGAERRRSEYRMPRFFKRLFKFPQMDFETAVWEMTHLMVAPKKVFKNILYSKRTTPAECCRRAKTWTITDRQCRDPQYLAHTGPSVHLPTLFLPSAHLLGLVARLHTANMGRDQTRIHVCLCPLPLRVPPPCDDSLLPDRPATGPRGRRTARPTTTTRTLWERQSGDNRRRIGVWILL